MFDPARLGAALQAINRVLIFARTLVGDGEDSQVVYQLLDQAEILPALLFPDRPDPTMDEFRGALAAIAEAFPQSEYILQDYDSNRGVYA